MLFVFSVDSFSLNVVAVRASAHTSPSGMRVTLYVRFSGSIYPPCTPAVGASHVSVTVWLSAVLSFKLPTASGVSMPMKAVFSVNDVLPEPFVSVTAMVVSPVAVVLTSLLTASPALAEPVATVSPPMAMV